MTYSDGIRGYMFMGPGSVGQILDDGQTIAETATPFVNLGKEVTGYERDVTLDVVREWVKTGHSPSVDIPLEFRPKPEDAPDEPAPEFVVQDDE